VIDLIDFKKNWLYHIMTNEFKVGIRQQMRHIIFATREEIVQANHLQQQTGDHHFHGQWDDSTPTIIKHVIHCKYSYMITTFH